MYPIRSNLMNNLPDIQKYFSEREYCSYCLYQLKSPECICLDDEDEDQNCAFCFEPLLCQECCDEKITTEKIIENLLTELYILYGFEVLQEIGEKITNKNPYDIVLVKLLDDIQKVNISKIQKLLQDGASDPADIDFSVYNENYTLLQYVLKQENNSYPISNLLLKYSKKHSKIFNQKNRWGFTTLGNEIFQLLRSDYENESENHWEKIYWLLSNGDKLEKESLNFSGCTGCNYVGPRYTLRQVNIKKLVDLGIWFDLDEDISKSNTKKLRNTSLGEYLEREFGFTLQKIEEWSKDICEYWSEK